MQLTPNEKVKAAFLLGTLWGSVVTAVLIVLASR